MSQHSDFCDAVEQGRFEAALSLIGGALRGLDSTASALVDQERQIAALARWLTDRPCVRGVSVVDGVQKRLPPQKIVTVEIAGQGSVRSFQLKLSMGSRVEIVSFEPL